MPKSHEDTVPAIIPHRILASAPRKEGPLMAPSLQVEEDRGNAPRQGKMLQNAARVDRIHEKKCYKQAKTDAVA